MKTTYIKSLVLLILMGLAITACKKEASTSLSTVSTYPAFAVASRDVILGIHVESDGGAHIIDCGIYIGNAEDPEKSGQRFQVGSDTGIFVGQLTGLTPGVQYYVKSFSKNEKGEAVGNLIVFATPATVADYDNNIYETVKIDNQTWMATNLQSRRYRNGDLIGTTTPSTADITGETAPEYQWGYNGDELNAATYGRLYTEYAVADARGVCPTGWHVPANSELSVLTTNLGGDDHAGGLLKETGTTHWNSPNTGANNGTLFSALPGGKRDDASGTFMDLGNDGFFWTATEIDAVNAWYCHISTNTIVVDRLTASKSAGLSVRCLKD